MTIKNGVRNFIFAIVFEIFTLALGLIVPRLIIFSYGSSINGLNSSISNIISYMSLLEVGVGASAIQAMYKPISTYDKGQINRIIAAMKVFYKKTGIAYLIIILIVSLIYQPIFAKELDYWFVFLLVLISGIPGAINYLFQRKYLSFLEAVGKKYVITNTQLTINLIASAAKILLINLGLNYVIVQSIYCLTCLGQMIFIYAYIKKKYPWISSKVEPDFDSLSQKNSVLIHQICALVTNSTDILLLSIFCDLKVVSIYGIYNMIFSIIMAFVATLSSSFEYYLGNAYTKGRKAYSFIFNNYETIYCCFGISLLAVTYIMVNPFLSLYTAGADIKYTSFIIPILFLCVKAFYIFKHPYITTISVSGHFRESKSHALIESIINLVVSLSLVWFLGIPGLLIGTLCAFIYRFVVSSIFCNKKILSGSSKHTIMCFVINLLGLVAFCVLGSFLTPPITSYIDFLLTGVFVTFFSILFFVLLNCLYDQKSLELVWISSLTYLKKIKNRGSHK